MQDRVSNFDDSVEGLEGVRSITVSELAQELEEYEARLALEYGISADLRAVLLEKYREQLIPGVEEDMHLILWRHLLQTYEKMQKT